jgi:excisionase family DNA binding protein
VGQSETLRDATNVSDNTPWLTALEATHYARRHINTINRALRSGELRGNQTARRGRWLIHRDDLDAWIRGEVADVQVPKVTRRRTA